MSEGVVGREPCVVCKREFIADELLYSSRGMVCPACEADVRLEAHFTRGLWMTVIAGIVLATTGTAFLCGAIILGPVGPFFVAAFGVAAVAAGVRSISVGVSLLPEDAEPKVGIVEKTALFVGGAIALLWGGGLALFGVLTLVMFALG